MSHLYTCLLTYTGSYDYSISRVRMDFRGHVHFKMGTGITKVHNSWSCSHIPSPLFYFQYETQPLILDFDLFCFLKSQRKSTSNDKEKISWYSLLGRKWWQNTGICTGVCVRVCVFKEACHSKSYKQITKKNHQDYFQHMNVILPCIQLSPK